MARVSKFVGTNFMTQPSPAGFGIHFCVADDYSVFVMVTFDESKQGGRGIVHGGAISAVLDEAMGVAAYEAGHAGYTATMTYHYASHVPLYEDIHIRAWVDKIDGKKVYAQCSATLLDGTIAVTGEALFIESEKLQKQLESNPYHSDDKSFC